MLEEVPWILLIKLLILMLVMNKGLANKCSSVRNVRQATKVREVCIFTPAANMKVFLILVNTAGIRQDNRGILRNIKNLFIFIYSCDKCNYQATRKSHLNTHKKSVHDGVKYSCDKCNYQATQQSNLKIHKESVHDGVKYSCDKCNYQIGWKQQLKVHKDRKHPQLP